MSWCVPQRLVRREGPTLSLWLLLFLFPGPSPSASAPEPEETPAVIRRDADWLQLVVDGYRARLEIATGVRVAVVPENELVASVEAPGGDGTFTLLLQSDFLATLSEDEVRAVVAHELGHVWIFTHHPYLQTEKLANDIARQIVTRQTLVLVYEKLWKVLGTKGDLAVFVGD